MPNQTRCCHVRSPSPLDINGSLPTQQVLTRPDQRGCTTGHRCRTCREWRTGSDRSPCQASPRRPETCVLACATGQSTWAVRSASTKFMPHAMHVSPSRAATSPCCPLVVVGGGFEQTSLACTRNPGARYSALHLAKTKQHRWPTWSCKARQRQDGWVSVTSQTGGEDKTSGTSASLSPKGQGAYRMSASILTRDLDVHDVGALTGPAGETLSCASCRH